MNHRWSDKKDFPLSHKSERSCLNGCGITKVTRHESEGGRETHWQEFWCDGEHIKCKGAPPCTGKAKAKHATYAAEGYPL